MGGNVYLSPLYAKYNVGCLMWYVLLYMNGFVSNILYIRYLDKHGTFISFDNLRENVSL